MNIEPSSNTPAQQLVGRGLAAQDQAASDTSAIRQAVFGISMVGACLGGIGGCIVSPVLGHVVGSSAAFISAAVSLGICTFSSCLLPHMDPNIEEPAEQNNRGA